jgi:hypothetical protein
MKLLRSINTKFWDDTWVTELSSDQKLIWLYLLTNSLTNLIGVYEISLKKIQFDTGIESFETVSKALKRFEDDKKAFYFQSHIVLVNFFANQSFNTNMIIGAKSEWNNLPKSLIDYILGNPLKGFESLLKGLGILPKKEDEKEDEKEKELTTTTTTTREIVFKIFQKKIPSGYDYKAEAEKFISMNEAYDWLTRGGRQILPNIEKFTDVWIARLTDHKQINNVKINGNGNGSRGINGNQKDWGAIYAGACDSVDEFFDKAERLASGAG